MMHRFFEWLAMGGYSIYVWPAYGLVASTLIIIVFSVKMQKKRTHHKLQQWFKGY